MRLRPPVRLQCRFLATVAVERNVSASNRLIIANSKLGDTNAARAVFDVMPCRDVVSWTAMISGYSQSGQHREALELFSLMRISPNQFTFGSVLKACGGVGCLRNGEQVHARAVKSAYGMEIIVESAAMDAYLRCGEVPMAMKMFGSMSARDVVCWNSMVRGLVDGGLPKEAMRLFVSMLQDGKQPDGFTFGSLLRACGAVGIPKNVEMTHVLIAKLGYDSDRIAIGSLLDSYVKCRRIREARVLYYSLREPDLICSTALICGYSTRSAYGNDGMELFREIMRKGMEIDGYILCAILSICANVVSLDFGRQIHAYICKRQIVYDAALGNSLIDMYAKSGELKDARRGFSEVPCRNVVSWTSLISGYGKNGCAEGAVTLFSEMESDGVKPNDVTFLSILSACGHAGLTDEGLEFFDSMVSIYGIHPRVEHYCSVVDLLARSGQINEAFKILRNMDVKPNTATWGAILGGCCMHRNVHLGEIAARNVINLDPARSVNYIVLANIYAGSTFWEESLRTRKLMIQRSSRKNVGCSVICREIILESKQNSYKMI